MTLPDTNRSACLGLLFVLAGLLAYLPDEAGGLLADPSILRQESNTWVKRSPLKGGPPSPGMGYEASLGYDPSARRVIRFGGHNQGGGGEQNAETWVLDPLRMRWELKEPNRSPPGACCNQQNVFDPVGRRFLRFPAFSGSHGWHWFRENYLNNTSVWSYDLSTNTWRDLAPVPSVHPGPLRCASWDSHQQVVVLFGGEGNTDGTVVYDPHTNTWTRLRPRVQPEFRSGGNMAYDAAHRLHILFGSQFDDDPHTWAFDLEKNEWRDLKPATQPPTRSNDAVLAYDAAGKVVIALVRVADQLDGKEVLKGHLETWAYDAGKNTWRPMKPAREPDGWGNRRRILTAIPDQNVLLLEAYVNPAERVPGVDREQQIWTYRYGDAPGQTGKDSKDAVRVRSEPRLVEDIVVSVLSPREVRLTWKAPAEDNLVGYHVERAPVAVFTEDELLRLKKDTPPLPEPSVGALQAIGTFVRLTETPVKSNAFTDTALDLTRLRPPEGKLLWSHRFRADQLDPRGRPYRYAVYAYRVRAVNAQGVQSGPSPALLTIPSAPQWLFAREEGGLCRLKWTSGSETNLRGYRVYRMEGPRINGPGQKVTRLTAQPIPEPRYADAAAGRDTRRYWVVAVDTLGQEGFPSAPAWHYRQYRKYYQPFVGEWHQ
jgi:hypothetical protein